MCKLAIKKKKPKWTQKISIYSASKFNVKELAKKKKGLLACMSDFMIGERLFIASSRLTFRKRKNGLLICTWHKIKDKPVNPVTVKEEDYRKVVDNCLLFRWETEYR